MENHSTNAVPGLRRFLLAEAVLVLCFSNPLWKLVHFAAASELYSYILLIPFISAYLLWLKRSGLPVSTRPARPLGMVFLFAGVALLAAYWLRLRSILPPVIDDHLMVTTICFLLFFYGIACFFWGSETLRAAAFPLGFLILLAPAPFTVVQQLDAFLQWGSAQVAAVFFSISGTPFLQDGLTFQLSDIKLDIAPQCSGIHSTMVLLITALVSGHIFLRTPWKRAVLVLLVVPLGLFRNGFRVFVIGQLCIHWGPQMINSPIHRKGGPIFFVLSLFPLFLALYLLLKSDRPCPTQLTKMPSQPCAN